MGLQIIIADQDIGIQDLNCPFGRAAAVSYRGCKSCTGSSTRQSSPPSSEHPAVSASGFCSVPVTGVGAFKVLAWLWGGLHSGAVRSVWVGPAVLSQSGACAEVGLTFSANRSHSRKKSCSTSRSFIFTEGKWKRLRSRSCWFGFFLMVVRAAVNTQTCSPWMVLLWSNSLSV